MDENHDDMIDYNDVVTVLEKYQFTTDVQEQVQNNQIFWSTIDQYQVKQDKGSLFFFSFSYNYFSSSFSSLI